MELARRSGKLPVRVHKDVPGFVGNRLQFAVVREALHIVSEGIASAQDVAAVIKHGLGLRWAFLGPLEIADLGGLGVFHSICTYLLAGLSDAKEPAAALADRVRAGHLGVKSGLGFYDYRGKQAQEIIARRDRRLIQLLRLKDS